MVLGVMVLSLISWELMMVFVAMLGGCCVDGWVMVTLGVTAVRLVLSSGRLFFNVWFGIKYITW